MQNQIVINNPCSEKLSEMQRIESGFYCGVCKKNVINFTNYTEDQLKSYFSTLNNKSTCGVFLPKQVEITYLNRKNVRYFSLNKLLVILAYLFSCFSLKAQSLNTEKIQNEFGSDNKVSNSKPKVELNKTESYKSISGKIVSDDSTSFCTKGDPLLGVTILIKGTTRGTTTDINGEFEILNVPINSVLLVSYFDFKQQEFQVCASDSSIYFIRLKKNEQSEEIVVVGYATQKHSKLESANKFRLQKSKAIFK